MGKSWTSLVRSKECDCFEGPPPSSIEDCLALCLSQQPSLPGSFSGTCGQHVSDLLPAYTDHTVGRGPPGEGTMCLSGPLFPSLCKEAVGPAQRSPWSRTWLSPPRASGGQQGTIAQGTGGCSGGDKGGASPQHCPDLERKTGERGKAWKSRLLCSPEQAGIP